MPKVTVLMPVFNVENYVGKAIESILDQSFSDFKLLIIDDCSTDNTCEIVESYKDSRITLIRNECNLGLAENLNKGLSLIDAEYVSRMDGDDIAEPDWLEKEVAVLDIHPEIGVCGAGFEWFGTKKGIVIYPESSEDIAANMLFSCTTIVPTFRLSLFRDNGLKYKSDAFPAEDYRFWAECIRVTKFYNIPEVLFHYRMHETQICSSKRSIQIEKVKEVQEYMFEWLSDKVTAEDCFYYYNQFLYGNIVNKRDVKEARNFSRKLLEYNKEKQHFSEVALKKRFKTHINASIYNRCSDTCFSNGYSPIKYARYLCSGLAMHQNIRIEGKLFVKSLLWYRK